MRENVTDIVDTTSKQLTRLAARIRLEHEASAIAMKRGLDHAMTAGDLLREAKRLAGHGHWLPWLRDHFVMTDRTASRCMRIVKNRKVIEANPKRFEGLNILEVDAMLRQLR